MKYLILNLWWWIVGKWCEDHNVRFRSPLCPRHMRLRIVRAEMYDRRVTARAEGNWPQTDSEVCAQ
jgi:hypothetical protein